MMKAILLKVKWNKGKTENGTEYDYTRVTLQLPVFEGASNEFGVDSADYEYGRSDDHVKLMAFKGKLPCEVDVESIQVKKGNNTLNQIISLRPISK